MYTELCFIKFNLDCESLSSKKYALSLETEFACLNSSDQTWMSK